MNHSDVREVLRHRGTRQMRRAIVAAGLLLCGLGAVLPASAQSYRISQTEMRLEPGNEVAEHDLFGESVAVSGHTMVIGGEGADTTLPDTGAAWIFERVGHTWVQTAKL